MRAIEIARRMAELGQTGDACRAYRLALQEEGGQDPVVSMEAALYILQFGKGNDYQISYTVFHELYDRGCFQADILSIMDEAFYQPNVKRQKRRYQANCRLLAKYPYLFRRDFPEFEDLPLRFYPFDDGSYLPFDRLAGRFLPFYAPGEPVVRHYFFKNLDDPILAEDVISQYELEYLRDNVRKSEYVGRENHIYLHYSKWETFCAYLAALDMKPLLRESKVVFLMEEERSQYPIDFKERFGVDYGQYPVKPVGVREINRMIWHTQLSAHNGGDFFNEVFDEHPNLVSLTSMILAETKKVMGDLKTSLGRSRSWEQVRKGAEGWTGLAALREVFELRDRTDKDLLVLMYLEQMERFGIRPDPSQRIAPALFYQPHFSNMEYELKVDERGNTALFSEQYEEVRKDPVFREFRYIKTFTPIRRPTTSYTAGVRFCMKNKEIFDEDDSVIRVLNDPLFEEILNRSIMTDPDDRLFRDCRAVRFEDGKLNPKATFTALAAFLDIPYTESMTYCSMMGERDPEEFKGNVRGFDPASVYKTYDEYANHTERYFLEYFRRDVYEYFGYDFQYYDGLPVDEERAEALIRGFDVLDAFIRKGWLRHYREGVQEGASIVNIQRTVENEKGEKTLVAIEDPEKLKRAKELVKAGTDPEKMMDDHMARLHQIRVENTRVLLGGLRFVGRSGQPLRFMPKLELDPALLEQPLYH